MVYLAEITGLPIDVPIVELVITIGAAILAGMGNGFHRGEQHVLNEYTSQAILTIRLTMGIYRK